MVAAAVFAGLCLALLWRLIDMPVWRTPQGVYKCPNGPVYAGDNDPCCPIGSSLSPSPSVVPSPSPSVVPSPSPSPSIEPSPSPSPSVSPSPSPSPSPSGIPFPGPGWYCAMQWLGPSCPELECWRAFCLQILTPEDWASRQFGVCEQLAEDPPEFGLLTTNGVPHETQIECIEAGCACP